MKRSIALLLTLVMAFALCACGSNSNSASNTKEEPEEKFDVIVEDCAKAWDGKDYVAIKPKIHNCTDMDAAYLSVNCELIDKDGRTIRVATCDGIGGVVAGASEWASGTIQISKDELANLAELKFNGCGFDISKDGKMYRQTVRCAETTFTRDYIFGE